MADSRMALLSADNWISSMADNRMLLTIETRLTGIWWKFVEWWKLGIKRIEFPLYEKLIKPIHVLFASYICDKEKSEKRKY